MHVKSFLVFCTAAVAFTSAANPPVQQEDLNTPVPESYRCSLAGGCGGKGPKDEAASATCYKKDPRITQYIQCCREQCPENAIKPEYTCRAAGTECNDRDESVSVFCRASSSDWTGLSQCCESQCAGSEVPASYVCPNVGYTCKGSDDVAALACHSRHKSVKGFTECCSQTCSPIPSFVRGH
ncbi:unnamed protein product [Hyaloperonospora brassicae]|uniref:Cysteine-rich protein n=1 Tax=Hyaloperonospora brassicae TaxID=162125 RepID=A0AAV0TQM8_HYABA|nr:unnamed protein product [Hyaloperonospora brassicae]